jgi:hypothetical protein
MSAPSPLKSAAPLGLLALTMLLSACEEKTQVVVKPDAEVSVITSSDGATVSTATDGSSLEVTDRLPAFAPLYPGATVKTRISDVAGKDGSSKGLLLVMNTPDPVAKVAAFYDEKAKAAGVKPGMYVNEKDSAVRIFGSGASEGRSAEGALIAISRADEGPGTDIVITSGVAREQVETWEKADFKDVPRALPRLQ